MVIKSQGDRYSPILHFIPYTNPYLPWASFCLNSEHFSSFYFNRLPCNGNLLLPHIGKIFYNFYLSFIASSLFWHLECFSYAIDL
jgi:hypothetical protein